jgi:hypothetical protein
MIEKAPGFTDQRTNLEPGSLFNPLLLLLQFFMSFMSFMLFLFGVDLPVIRDDASHADRCQEASARACSGSARKCAPARPRVTTATTDSTMMFTMSATIPTFRSLMS